MDDNVVERDPGMCVCNGGPTLEILKEIQRLYEERMEQINRASGSTKLQQQVGLLRSWVGDLVGQNTLLARAVEELETAATSKLLLERRKNSEVVSELRAECAALRRRLARKDSDLRGLVEVLRRLREFDYCTLDGIHFFEVTESDIFGSVEWRQKKLEQGDSVKTRTNVKHDTNRYKTSRHFRRNPKSCAKVSELKVLNETLTKENMAKDREIRQLNKDAQCYEQTIMNLRKEMSNCKYHTPEVSMKDAEVMAGMCCTGNECGEWEPVKDFSEMLRDETMKYQERVHKMEANLKASGDSIRALRKVNVTLTEEMHSMRRVCAALDEQCRAANMRAQFKDDIIKEMRRQLKQAKAKTQAPEEIGCFFATTSTPNASIEPQIACATSMPNISVIERSTSVPVLVSDASIADLQTHFSRCHPTKKNETFQINTLRFIEPPKDSPTCSPRLSPTCSPRLSPRSSPDNGSLNNFLPRDAIRICLPKKPARICIPRESPRICFIKKPSEDIPNTCPRLERTGSKSSLNNFLPKESPKSCLPRKRCKFCSKPKKTTFKDGCIQSAELVSSDETEKCECMVELYFNDEAKRSGGSSPRGQTCKERNSEFLKLQPECSIEALKRIIKEKKRRSCERDTKDSGATSSLAESASATCDASATYYHNKLLATLQILQNKEETISVQADSLAVAEQRIATLNERANELKKELDRKTKEYSALRKTVECCKPQQVDACFVTDRPMEDQTDIVNTLQNNLSVIEDLYRECFYETAKQENLIEMLRSSYLDVRVMDKQKADQIGHLQTVINSQQWSLDRCQDIAMEVDGLKMEISNFLNSSSSTNNDSGMWERSEESYAPATVGVQDDLQDVREQLLRLQDILAYDSCTCGFNEENMKWKKKAESLEIKVAELRGKLCELECNLASKWDTDAKFKADIELKDQELERIREQLVRSQNSSREQSSTVESMSIQLGQTKALLSEKTAEVTELRQENESQAHKITDLKEELAKADHIIKENCKMRSEVAYLTTQVSLWRSQLDESKRRVHALEADLARTRAHAEHIDECYREKASKVAELQAHLEAAHARGTALCGEARRAVCGVRVWMRRMRDKHREKDAILKEKEGVIAVLRRRLEERQNDSQLTSASENTASCSKCLSSRDVHSFCSKTGRERQRQCPAPSEDERPSCSSTPTSTPMRLRKRPCGNNYLWICDEEMQAPTRRDAASDAPRGTFGCRHAAAAADRDVRHVRLTLERAPRDVSPTEDLLLRVEQLSEALADGNRRWSRARDKR